MRWINFPDGGSYTFAVDIQKFAEKNGYKVPCEPDGTRHPGTDCNQKMRTLFKDSGTRMTFGLTAYSVIDVRAEDNFLNESFIDYLVEEGFVSVSLAKKGRIQLYTKEAVSALLSAMLKTHVEYERDENDEEWNCPHEVVIRSHSLELKKNKPKASLFNK